MLVLAMAGPAGAQEAADPIGGLLDQIQAAPDPDDPEADSPPDPIADAPLRAPHAPYVPPSPPPTLNRPVHVDETGRTPEGPPNPVEAGYDARLRASFSSAQGLQGPLDGAWTLRGADGAVLYTLQMVDNGLALEGAWRDPRRQGAADASGFLNEVRRDGPGVVISFYPAPGAGLASLDLEPSAGGTWMGELEERGRRRPVVLNRN